MSIMFAALNPNISDTQLLELVKKDGAQKLAMVDHFNKCIDSVETDEQKKEYITVCLPVLLHFLFF